MCVVFLQVVEKLLNGVGETVTRLFNLSVKQFDSSWLTQLLLMLRSHAAVLRTLCAVVCQLVLKQASALSDCHAHALAAILVHLSQRAECSAGISVQHSSSGDTNVKVTMPFVSYILESLPVSTTAQQSFSLVVAASYVTYAQITGHSVLPDENEPLPEQQPAESADGREIPSHLLQLLSYLGPRLIRGLRPHCSNLGSRESIVSSKFLPVERFLLNDLVRSRLERDRMSLETWVQKEIEVADDDGVSCDWLNEYYNWVVFTRWHKSQSESASEPYVTSVLRVLAQALLDSDTRYSQTRASCYHNTSQQQQKSVKRSGRHSVFSFLQVSNQLDAVLVVCICWFDSAILSTGSVD